MSAPMTDPTLVELLADIDRAQANLRAYLSGSAMPTDLLTLKQIAHEFCRSEDTARRWAIDEGLGVKIGGRWMISRAVVNRHKLMRA